jgi:leucyl/phenylalanyl-tRNA--protein transferase
MFAGESMFHQISNASKVAFVYLVEQLDRMDIGMFDAQVVNAFTLQLGATLMRRSYFLRALRQALGRPTPFDGQHWSQHPPPLGNPPFASAGTGT